MIALLNLAQADTPDRFRTQVPPQLCVGSGERVFLFGGIALAAAMEAMERASGLPASHAAAQFLVPAIPGSELEIQVRSAGGSLRQCAVEATASGTPFLRVTGACGRRADGTAYQGSAPPAVAQPADCPERSVARLLSSNLQALLEFRLAAGVLPDRAGWSAEGGQDLACWVRARDGALLDRRLLTVIADCAALAVPGALGRPASGSSLDNAIRFVAPPQGEWVLFATRIEAVLDGLVHTRSRLFSEDGRLLALASQTMALRLWG